MSFQYQPRSEAEVTKRSTGNIFDSFIADGVATFSAKKTNTVRILPPTWQNPRHFGFDVWVHYNVGPNNGTVICIYKMKNEKCPMCEAFARAELQGREDARELKPTRRVLLWLVDRVDPVAKDPFLWASPVTFDQEVARICKDRETGELYQIDNPEIGYDVYFDTTGEGVMKKYVGFSLAKRPSSIDMRHVEYVVQRPAPSMLVWRSYEEIKTVMGGDLGTPDPPAFQTPLASTAQMQAPPIMPATSTAAVAPPPPAVVAAPPPPPPIVPAAPFVSAWLDSKCGLCGEGQFTIQNGGYTCSQGHLNAPPAGNGHAAPPAAPPVSSAARADALRQQFSTGK